MAENTPANNPFLSDSEVRAASPTSPSRAPVQGSGVRPAPTGAPVSVPPKVIEQPGPAFTKDSETARKKWFRWGGMLFLVLLIAGGVYWWWQRPTSPSGEPVQEATPLETNTPTPTVTEETPQELLGDTANYRSENFKAGEIVFLGEAQFLQGDEGVAPLTLDSIRGEAFTEKNKKEVKLVITWKTNKLSSAEIAYAKGIGQTPKTVTEDDYSYNHSMILTGLDPASTYLYTVKATDRFGNVVTSEPYAVFTGARSVSLFDLIAGAIGDVFGWAVK